MKKNKLVLIFSLAFIFFSAVIDPLYGQLTVLSKEISQKVIHPNPAVFEFSGNIIRDGAPVNGDYDVSIDVICIKEKKVVWKELLSKIIFDEGDFSIPIGLSKDIEPIYKYPCEIDPGTGTSFSLNLTIIFGQEKETLSIPFRASAYAFKSKFSDHSTYTSILLGKFLNDDFSNKAGINFTKLDISKDKVLQLLYDNKEKDRRSFKDIVQDVLPEDMLTKNAMVSALNNDVKYLNKTDAKKQIESVIITPGLNNSFLKNDQSYLIMDTVDMSEVQNGFLSTKYGGVSSSDFNTNHFIYFDSNGFISDDVATNNYLRSNSMIDLDERQYDFIESAIALTKSSRFDITDRINIEESVIVIPKKSTFHVNGPSQFSLVNYIVFSDGSLLSTTDIEVNNQDLNDNAIKKNNIENNAVITNKINDNTIIESKIKSKSIDLKKLDEVSLFGNGLFLNKDHIQLKSNSDMVFITAKGLSIQNIILENISGLKDLSIRNTIDSENLIAHNLLSKDHVKESSLSNKSFSTKLIKTEILAKNAITSDQLRDDAVDNKALVKNGVTTKEIINNGISSEKIANDAIITEKITDKEVSLSKLDSDDIFSGSFHIDSDKLAIKYNSDELTISSDGLSINEVTTSKITGLKALALLDTINQSNLIEDNVIIDDKIKEKSLTKSVFSNQSVDKTKLGENSIDQDELSKESVKTASIQNDAITSEKVASSVQIDGALVNDGDTRSGKDGVNSFRVNFDIDDNNTNDRIDAFDDGWEFQINDNPLLWVTSKAIFSNITLTSAGTISGKSFIINEATLSDSFATLEKNEDNAKGAVQDLLDKTTIKSVVLLEHNKTNTLANSSKKWTVKSENKDTVTIDKDLFQASKFKGSAKNIVNLTPLNLKGLSNSGKDGFFLNEKGELVDFSEIKVATVKAADSALLADVATAFSDQQHTISFDNADNKKQWLIKAKDTAISIVNSKEFKASKFLGDGSGLTNLSIASLTNIDADNGDPSKYVNQKGKLSAFSIVETLTHSSDDSLIYDDNAWSIKANNSETVTLSESKMTVSELISNSALTCTTLETKSFNVGDETLNEYLNKYVTTDDYSKWVRPFAIWLLFSFTCDDDGDNCSWNILDKDTIKLTSKDTLTSKVFTANLFKGAINNKKEIIFKVNSSEEMRIINDGKVGIGVTNPSELLEVKGKVKVDNISSSSDKRLKKNISSETSFLRKLSQLSVKQFHLKTQHNDEKKQIGFVAQDVQDIYPELVLEPQVKSGYLSLYYDRFAVLSVGAIQELKREKDSEIARIKTKNTVLKKRLDVLKATRLKKIKLKNEALKNDLQKLNDQVAQWGLLFAEVK